MQYGDVKKLKHVLAIMKKAHENDKFMFIWESDVEIVEEAVKELEASAEV